MNAKDIIQIIREEVRSVRARFIAKDTLEIYLNVLEKGIDTNATQFRAHREYELARSRMVFESDLEEYRTVTQGALEAIKSAMLINGGAAVALLAFLGSVYGAAPPLVVPGIAGALLKFVYGVLSAAVAAGTAYLTNYSYAQKWIWLAKIFHGLSIIWIICSYALFLYGAWGAHEAFVGR